MTPTTTLLEPSILDLVAAIQQAPELSEQRRRHWICSLRQVANWLDRPAAAIPARWQSVRMLVGQVHHARVGVTAKTLANHKSNLRASLRWFAKEYDVPQQGVRLSPDWARFRDALDQRVRYRLYHLIRYCSARQIHPTSVDDQVFADYWCYRSATTGRASNNIARRRMIRAWNGCAATAVRRSSASPSPRSRKPNSPGMISPKGCARTLTITSVDLPGPTAALQAGVFSRAVRQQSGPAGPNLSRWRVWRFASGYRLRAWSPWPLSSSPMWSNWSLTPTGKRAVRCRRWQP